MCGHSWQGNIRELQNLVERSVIFAGGDKIDAKDLELSEAIQDSSEEEMLEQLWAFLSKNKTLEDLERVCMELALKKLGGNRQKAADALGVSQRTVFNKLKKWKSERER